MSDAPEWLASGLGFAPHRKWSFTADAPLTSVEWGRETGEVLIADESGSVYRLDRRGRVQTVSRGLHVLQELAWSDTGNGGTALIGEREVCRLSESLEIQWTARLPECVLSLAVNPSGQYLAVSLANGQNRIYDETKQLVSKFETIRPLSHLRFMVTEPLLLGAAEYGLLCCHQLGGEQLWSQKLWTNVGELSLTGDGETIFIAGFNHGVQRFDGRGTIQDSFMVEGTPNRISTSFYPHRFVVTTMERHIYWLDSEGEMLWAASLPDNVCRIRCDPLGNAVVCGFESGRIVRLDWDTN